MNRPSFQFYPRDWLSERGLRASSFAARGLWADLMSIMHDCEPYGHLAHNGVAIPDAVAARMVGATVGSYRRMLKEIESHGVSSRTEGGVLYSRRMVRDERVRRIRALSGPLSAANPNVPRAKEGQEEGYPSDPSEDGPMDTFVGSPVVAAASSASELPSTATATARAELLHRLAKEPGRHDVAAFLEGLPPTQREIVWLRILIGCLEGGGMPGLVPATTSAVATACREFPALTDARWSPRFFKACVADAMRTELAHAPRLPNGSRSPKGRQQRELEAVARFVAKGEPK